MKTLAFSIIGILPLVAAAAPDFHADVAPIFRDYCVGCHNNDEFDGELSLETFSDLMRGGESGESIMPGDAAKSFLIRTVTKEEKPSMPPRKEPQPTEAEVAILKAWVDAGAKGPEASKDVSILSTLIVPSIAAGQDVQKPVSATDFSKDGKWLAVARYDSVDVMNAKTRRSSFQLKDHPGKVNAVHFSADGSEILTASGLEGLRGVAVLWDARSGKKLREFGEGSRDIFYDAEFSPDGKLVAAAGYDRVVRIFEKATGRELQSIDVHNGAIFDLAFNPDGKVLASASGDQTIKLWRVADGERLDTLNQPAGEQYSVAFTPDGRFILGGGGDNRIRMWRFVSREQPKLNPLVHARFAHEAEIVRLAVSPDGRTLVSSSADGTLKVWTLPGLEVATVFGDQPDLAAALAMEADGGGFTVGRMDGSIERYALAAAKTGAADESRDLAASARVAPADAPAASEPARVAEMEPNDSPAKAGPIQRPSIIEGLVSKPGDQDVFRFHAQAGDEWLFEVNANRMKSPLDSKIEILDAQGEPVERVKLQAVRDSWFTFRGKDSDTSSDFRVQYWMEMELNDYLYANGEVVRLWLYPRGPDSGFNVYPGFGKRHTFFGTSPLAHPLGEPCYIVRPLEPGAEPIANGLPVYTVYYENDDDPLRRWGSDSVLLFTAPEEGDYLVRVRDVRGQGGADYKYSLTARAPKPDFKLTLKGQNPSVSPGSGKEFTLTADRMDEFDGEIRVDITGLPKGFIATTPIIIEKGQYAAEGIIFAEADAKTPTPEEAAKVKLTATAMIRGKKVSHEVGSLGKVQVGAPSKVTVEIVADGDLGQPVQKPGGPLELTIHPGETISAIVRAHRAEGFKDQLPFGKEDSGRNLPFGVFVDNIGLSGLLILQGQDERKFFITAGPEWLPETSRLFHLRTTAAGTQTTRPVLLHIKKKPAVAAK